MRKWLAISLVALLLLPSWVKAEGSQEVEPNNDKEKASVIADFTDETTVKGTLSDDKDEDFYLFTTERTGLKVDVKTNPQVEIAVRLYAADGTELQAWYGDKEAEPKFVTLFGEGLSAGKYYVKVSVHQGQGKDIPYEVRFNKEKKRVYEQEVNDDLETATALEFGQEMTVFLDDVDRQDVLSFTVKEQGVVAFDFLASEYADYEVEIFDAKLNEIDHFPVEAEEDGGLYEMARHGLRPGTYYIAIINEETDFANAFTSLQLTFTATKQCELEPNNKAALATPLPVGETKRGVVYTNEDVDHFKFVQAKAGKATLSVSFKEKGTITATIFAGTTAVKTVKFTGKNKAQLALKKGTYTVKLTCESKDYPGLAYAIAVK